MSSIKYDYFMFYSEIHKKEDTLKQNGKHFQFASDYNAKTSLLGQSNKKICYCLVNNVQTACNSDF